MAALIDPCALLIERPHERGEAPRRGAPAAAGRAMYPDATLHYWADRFVDLRLAHHGVGLLAYLADPARYEHLAYEPEPLLTRQRAAVLAMPRLEAARAAGAARAEAPLADVPRRNGHAVAPMRHRRHPKRELRRARFSAPPEAIGACEWCGRVDHHLVAGECGDCHGRTGCAS